MNFYESVGFFRRFSESVGFLPRRGLLCRASKFWMMLGVCPSDVTLIWMHLDADPDLDASTNRAFRDVRDVGPTIFGQICALGR